MNYALTKSERLCSKKLIEALFEGGHKSMSAYPIRAVFMPVREDLVPQDRPLPPVQVLMSVSKRRFKHAVDRNRAKRQLREAYRLQKNLLIDTLPPDRHLAIGFIWVADQHFPTSVIQTKMQKLLLRISEEAPISTSPLND